MDGLYNPFVVILEICYKIGFATFIVKLPLGNCFTRPILGGFLLNKGSDWLQVNKCISPRV